MKKIVLVAADICLLYLSLWIALAIRYQNSFTPSIFDAHLYPFTIAFAVWIAALFTAGLYEQRLWIGDARFYATATKAVLIAILATVILFYLIPSFGITPKTNLLITGLVFFTLFILWRNTWNALTQSRRLLHTTICIGTNKEIAEVHDMLARHPHLGYTVAEIIDHTGQIAHLKERVRLHHADTVVYANNAFSESMSGALYSLLPLGIAIVDLPTFYADIMYRIPISIIGEAWFLENLIERDKNVFEMEKRLVDVAVSCLGIVVCLPFLPFIAGAIAADSGAPVFYTQKRIGRNGRIFQLLKLRTMVKNAEESGATWTTKKDARITRVGSFLRKTRIDELPQLWNILVGDMSFVGPRPERPEFVEKLETEVPHYHMRHLVRPGLTGWAQIHQPLGGASVKDTTEKLQYDLYYIKYRNLMLDISIILKTIPVVLSREGH